MHAVHRYLLLGCLTAASLSGCDLYGHTDSATPTAAAAGSATTANAAATPPPVSPDTAGFTTGSTSLPGTDNLVVATPSNDSVAVVAGASQTVSISFTSSDGRPMTGFAISGTLGALPVGWTGPSSFICASLSTGSGCVLNLTYAPTAVAGGTLNVDYVVVDNAGLASTTGTVAIAYVATAEDNVIASVSPTGQVDAVIGAGASPVNVNFTTDDGNAATNLVITSDLGALPTGWSAGVPALTCAIVSTGSGCEITLSYAAASQAGGVLTLAYRYSDDSGAAKTGTVNIPYFATTADSVVPTVSPAGQIIAVQKTGGQAVPVTFNTDDGKTATQLAVTTDLHSLPPGWTAAAGIFTCSTVATGSGCQLALNYAPMTLGGGTLTLNYTYVDDHGTPRSGLLNIPYTATTSDNVVGTVSPAGQINAIVGQGSRPVTATFTTDDGRPATALRLTSNLSALPAGWTSSATAFSCSGINVDTVCRLSLAYAPAVADHGTLVLNYSYQNNAGHAGTGTLSVVYRATTIDTVAGTPNPPSLTVRTGSSTTVLVSFATSDGNPGSMLSLGSALAALPAGWSTPSDTFACATVSAGTNCLLSLTYAPTTAGAGALGLGFSYLNDSGQPGNNTASIPYLASTPFLYVADSVANTVSACPLNIDNTLAACEAVGAGFAAPDGMALNGSHAYVTDTQNDSVSLCTVAADGMLASCNSTGGSFSAPTAIVINPAGSFAYVTQSTGVDICAINAASGALGNCAASSGFNPTSGIALSTDGTAAFGVVNGAIQACSVNAGDGTLSACAAVSASTPQAVAALAVQNSTLYVSNVVGSLYVCPISGAASIASCRSSAVGTNAVGLAVMGGTAYVSGGGSTLAVCPVNADGTLGTCGTAADPTFNGTAGLALH